MLASLLDGVRAAGNRDIHITMTHSEKGFRIGPLHIPVDEEIESIHIKFLYAPPPRKSFSECVRRFNANVPYSGVLYSVTQDVSYFFDISNISYSFMVVCDWILICFVLTYIKHKLVK